VFAGARRDDVVRRYNLPAGDPERYRAIVLTDAGSKGLNLLETRHVHVMEPQFNRGRVEQAIARAIRKGSHARLPPEQRTVTVHEHFCVMPNSPKTDRVFVARGRRWSAENSGDSVMR
jgi:SNF2 family DNA or RNA helicase